MVCCSNIANEHEEASILERQMAPNNKMESVRCPQNDVSFSLPSVHAGHCKAKDRPQFGRMCLTKTDKSFPTPVKKTKTKAGVPV